MSHYDEQVAKHGHPLAGAELRRSYEDQMSRYGNHPQAPNQAQGAMLGQTQSAPPPFLRKSSSAIGAAPQRQFIMQELDSLRSRIEDLEKELNTLVDQLGPVLDPMPVQPRPSLDEPDAPASPAVGYVVRCHADVLRLCVLVASLRSRLSV